MRSQYHLRHIFSLESQRNICFFTYSKLDPNKIFQIFQIGSSRWKAGHLIGSHNFTKAVFSTTALWVATSGGNLFKKRPRASTSEYKQLPINLRLFQNTVKWLNYFFSPKKQKWENENFSPSPVLNTINSIVIFLISISNIWITAPGYPSKTSA